MALDYLLSPQYQPRPELAMNQYQVIVTVQYPAHDERDGIVFYVEAGNKQEAIRKARRISDREGQIHREQGRATWRAVLAS
jgi:hypothetical protein